MFIKKTFKILFVLSFLSLFSCKDETPQTGSELPTPETPKPVKETQLIVYFKDNTHVVYPLQNNPQITFVNGQLVVKTSEQEVQYDLQTLLRFTYE